MISQKKIQWDLFQSEINSLLLQDSMDQIILASQKIKKEKKIKIYRFKKHVNPFRKNYFPKISQSFFFTENQL
jgi:hypothetical protein